MAPSRRRQDRIAPGGRDESNERPDTKPASSPESTSPAGALHASPEHRAARPGRCAGRPGARRRRSRPSPPAGSGAPAPPGPAPAPAPRRSNHLLVPPARLARPATARAPRLGQGHGVRTGLAQQLAQAGGHHAPRAARPAATAWPPRGPPGPAARRCPSARSPSQRTTERAAANGTMRSTPSSVSFCTTSSGRAPLTRANPTVSAGAAHAAGPTPARSAPSAAPNRARRHRPRRRTPSPRPRPAAAATRSRWWRSAGSSSGRSRSSTNTVGPSRPPDRREPVGCRRDRTRDRPGRLARHRPTGTPSGSWTAGRCRRGRPPRPADSAKCAQLLLLLVAELGGRVHHHLHQQVAAPRPSTWGTPRPRSRKTRPVWVPRGTTRSSAPSRVSKARCVPERGLGHRQVQLVGQVVAVAHEAVVGPDPQVHVQVAEPPPRGPTAPRPVRRRVEPVSMPGGTSTV